MLEMKYFSLKPRSKHPNDPWAKASRMAMLVFAQEIEGVDAECAAQLREWVEREAREENTARPEREM